MTNCIYQHTKKYQSRDGPPYPGNECCGQRRVGNDGKMYVSKRAASGDCRWTKIVAHSRNAAPKKKKSKSRKSPKRSSYKKRSPVRRSKRITPRRKPRSKSRSGSRKTIRRRKTRSRR